MNSSDWLLVIGTAASCASLVTLVSVVALAERRRERADAGTAVNFSGDFVTVETVDPDEMARRINRRLR